MPKTTSQDLAEVLKVKTLATSFPGGNSEWVPPDPIPNSEVKLLSADGSVGPPHVRVGHRQGLIPKKTPASIAGVLFPSLRVGRPN